MTHLIAIKKYIEKVEDNYVIVNIEDAANNKYSLKLKNNHLAKSKIKEFIKSKNLLERF